MKPAAAKRASVTDLKVIADKAKRTNFKSKRTRTLFRKAIEVSKMCNIDVFILMKDRDSNKVIQYNSIGLDGATNFTIERAWQEL